uniref:Ribosome-recycling factor, chloroplastic n=2 Tax=Pelargonium TaxID=4030 RepID=A0A0G4APW7_9ROSI|nr:ribosome recycling factor [Pelargonium dichondrifolium]AKM76793.1 ribosome recycling factor [Pelargonium exstipulatum]
MAMYLRRAFSYRNVGLVRSRSSSIVQSRNFSNIVCNSSSILCDSQSHNPAIVPGVDFLRESRRGFAKGRKSRDDSGSSSDDVAVDIGPAVKENASAQMDAAIIALSRDLTKIRTGRASHGMLDHIIVETGGAKIPLNRLALVSVLDSKTLSINPYDPNTIKALQKAIVSSPFGLNPKEDGERLIAAIPPLTQEHIKAMCKVISKSSEDVKQSIRRARQKALDTIKKAGSNFPKDSAKRLEKEIDELTKKFVKSAEDMCKAKEKEITQG